MNPMICSTHRGSYMSVLVLLKGKSDKILGLHYRLFATTLLNSIKQQHGC